MITNITIHLLLKRNLGNVLYMLVQLNLNSISYQESLFPI